MTGDKKDRPLSSPPSLEGTREAIDALDDEILARLEARASLVGDVLRAKQQRSLATYDPGRERAVLDRLSARASVFPKEAVRAVYREVMSACLSLQEPVRVAFLGPEGTFSHVAARSRFGFAARYVEETTIAGVVTAVERGHAAFGIAPIENSTEGSVNDAVDALLASSVVICGELTLDISHGLFSHAESLSAVERVASHPQALGQCRGWLAKNLPTAQLVHTTSTAQAVRDASADPRTAAIAGPLAGEIFGVPCLRDSVEDSTDNATRFVILSRATDQATRTGHDTTTLAFSLNDGRGALLRVLALFDAEECNLTRIHSRPSRKKSWDYVFFVDLDGHREDPNVSRAIERLAEACPFVKLLGSYPKAIRETPLLK